MNIPYVMKKCSCCGEWLVANTVNFTRNKNGRYGLESQCKKCRNKKNERWRLENKDKIAEYGKQYREANKDKEVKRHKQYYEANRDKILEYQKQYSKQYYEANKDKIAKCHKQWCENNKGNISEYNKQYRETNKEKITEYQKQYRQSPQGKVASFNACQRRRAKEQQGDGITKEQWLEMMNYFNWKCAYSGETLTKDTRSIDHIVPLNSNGDNMIWNCVPMLRSLNSSKQEKDMLEWYKEQDCYDPKRLAKIYEWQEYARKKWKNS